MARISGRRLSPRFLTRELIDWSADPNVARQQMAAMDAADAAYEAGDLTGLRVAVTQFVGLMKGKADT